MDAKIRKAINKVKTTNKLRCSGSGFYGEYFKINSKVGVKLLRNDEFESIKEAKRSDLWEEAHDEKNLLRIAPKPYCVRVIRHRSDYRIGIFMEHIDGTVLKDGKDANVIGQLRDYLNAGGIDHDDCNGKNVMVRRGRNRKKLTNLVAIDFSPELIFITEPRQWFKPIR
jgi:hypothetical protein